MENHTFLDARLLFEGFLRPLLPYREQTAALIFEFGTFAKGVFARAADLAADFRDGGGGPTLGDSMVPPRTKLGGGALAKFVVA